MSSSTVSPSRLGVDLPANLFLQFFERFVAADLFVFRHVIGHAPFTHGSRARAIARQMRFVQLQVGQNLVCFVELSCILAAEADDYVRVLMAALWNGCPNVLDEIAILCLRVAPPHARQNLVVAGLDRDFDVFTYFGQVADRFKNSV